MNLFISFLVQLKEVCYTTVGTNVSLVAAVRALESALQESCNRKYKK